MAKSKHKFRFRLFLWVNQFFVFLLLLTYLSPYTPPQVFWPLSVFGLAYPILLLINILFVAFWLLLVNKNLLYSLLAILVGLSTLNKHFKFKGSDSTETAGNLKVLTFNVKNLSNNNINYADIKVRTAIQDYLREQKTQIICFQEFQTYPSKGINTVKDFQEKLNLPYAAEAKYIPNSKMKFVDLMTVFSKYPIINQQELRFQDKCYSLITDIVYNKDTIRLFNIHLESNHFAKGEYEIFSSPEVKINEETKSQVGLLINKLARFSKIRNIQVNRISEQIKKSPFPIIICGDFNDTPASYAYQKLSKNKKDAFVKKGKGYGNTYNGKLPAMRIDYILCDTAFQIYHFEIGKINQSDHYPVMSTLSLSSEK